MRHSGVVVEIGRKNQVIVLTAQGEFVQVPFKKHVQVGQEIRYTPKRERLNVWQLSLAATLFLALVGTWPLISMNFVPTSMAPAFIITLDINPSLELQITDDQKVLTLEGLNRDGQNLAAKTSVVGDSLRSALTKITNQATSMGYIKQGQSEVVVTIASQKDQNVKLAQSKSLGMGEHAEIEQTIAEAFGETQLAQVQVWQVPRSLQTEARLAGIIPSRYIAIQMPASPVPASPIIPQRPETKLTMNDAVEEEEVPVALSRPQSLQANAPPAKPALTPSRWTKTDTDTVTRTGLYNMDFSVAGLKGDL